jgi:hypothetical protein
MGAAFGEFRNGPTSLDYRPTTVSRGYRRKSCGLVIQSLWDFRYQPRLTVAGRVNGAVQQFARSRIHSKATGIDNT